MPKEPVAITTAAIDHSEFMGRELKLHTGQFPNRTLTTRIVAVNGRNLMIDRSGSGGLVDDLINNQEIEVSLSYRGEPVIFKSKIAVPKKGRLIIPLAENVFPQLRRAFERVSIIKDVKLTYFDNVSISSARLNKLKWIETESVNISGGGILVEVPANLGDDYFMILHLELEGIEIPRLLVGRIRHCQLRGTHQFCAGVEFMIKENYREKLPKNLLRNLPASLFDFNDDFRRRIDEFLNRKQRDLE